MKYSLRQLFSNAFEDHRGRPGKVGGSLPKSGGTGPKDDDDEKTIYHKFPESKRSDYEHFTDVGLREQFRKARVAGSTSSIKAIKEEMDRRRHIRQKKYRLTGRFK
jgi:hypothetical protein